MREIVVIGGRPDLSDPFLALLQRFFPECGLRLALEKDDGRGDESWEPATLRAAGREGLRPAEMRRTLT